MNTYKTIKISFEDLKINNTIKYNGKIFVVTSLDDIDYSFIAIDRETGNTVKIHDGGNYYHLIQY